MMVSFRKISILFLALFAGIFLVPGSAVYATEDTTPLPETVREGNMYAVNPDGTGDFVSIQEGVDSVESGDTLIIYPGVYEENVIIENKTVNLIGVSPKYCILTANSDNYHHIPLTIAAGRVSGLTICGTGTEESVREMPDAGMDIRLKQVDLTDQDAIYALQDQYSGYVIHVDDAYAGGKTLCIENCRIISENNYCMGIGCWGNTEIIIEDCELIAGGISGCLFIHNNAIESGPSQVTVKDTKLYNYVSPYVMSVYSEGELNPLTLTFQNVKVHTVAYENNDCYHENNINTWYPIDLIEHPIVRAILTEEGYRNLPESRQIVHQCTEQEHVKFNKALEEQDSPLEGWPDLAEGITYWESGSDQPFVIGKTRQSIDMENVDAKTIGDGWCGLSSIYLSKDSYGNTLPEMNYPRPVVAPVTESESE